MNFIGRRATVLYFEFHNCFNTSKLQMTTHENITNICKTHTLHFVGTEPGPSQRLGRKRGKGSPFANIFSSFLKIFESFCILIYLSVKAFCKYTLKLFENMFLIKLFANIFKGLKSVSFFFLSKKGWHVCAFY